MTVGGDVITTGDTSPGIYAQGNSVELVIDGSVATSGFSSGAVAAMAYGDAVVRGTGSVETGGILSRGVLAQSYGGDAIVDLSNVATAAESSSGITASSVTGETRVTVGSVSTGGGYSAGIQAFSTYGNVTVAATGAIRTEGMVSDGVRASGRGVIDVSVHDVETLGESSSAVVAMGSETHVAISGLVRTTGDSLRSGSGAYQAAIFASASSAPDAAAPAGTVTVVNDGTIETTGYHTAGIQALAERGVSIGGEGAVRTEGASQTGSTPPPEARSASRAARSPPGG